VAALLATIDAKADLGEARQALRRTLKLGVLVQPSEGISEATIHDLSETGLMIGTAAELSVGEWLIVELPDSCSMPAEVIWRQGNQAGCRFVLPVTKAVVSAALLLGEQLKTETVSADQYDFERVEEDSGFGVQAVMLVSLLMLIIALFVLLMALTGSAHSLLSSH
jgi:hypothetical protein